MSLHAFARHLPGLDLDGEATPGRTLANALAAFCKRVVHVRDEPDPRLTPTAQREQARAQTIAAAKELGRAIDAGRREYARMVTRRDAAQRQADRALWDAALPAPERAEVRHFLQGLPAAELRAFLVAHLKFAESRAYVDADGRKHPGEKTGSYDLAATLAAAPRLIRQALFERADLGQMGESLLQRYRAPLPAEFVALDEQVREHALALRYADDVARELLHEAALEQAASEQPPEGPSAVEQLREVLGVTDVPEVAEADPAREMANGRDPAAAAENPLGLGRVDPRSRARSGGAA